MTHPLLTSGFILAIDQGTSSTKSVLVDEHGAIVSRGVVTIGEAHPNAGWVEQDADEIWASVCTSIQSCLEGFDPTLVRSVGLSTQRESLLAWDAYTAKPLAPMISWQDQRTVALCDSMRNEATEALVFERSGLPLDPMFSATKARWLLDHLDPDRTRSSRGEIHLGTLESWLIRKLSGQIGRSAVHLAEIGNASRTQLMDVRAGDWSDDLLRLFRVPRATLATIVPSDGPFPPIRGVSGLPDGVSLGAVMGDSHSALFAHGVTRPGQVKVTYGTGSSIMGLVDEPDTLRAGLCLTIGWQTGGQRPTYAVEGNIRASGATLRWAANLLNLSPTELVDLASSSLSNGVVLVPGFNGLGAPWWRRDAVGLLTNLSLGSGRAQVARAALESIAHQVADVVEALQENIGPVHVLYADGGASRSDALMGLQSDLLGCQIKRSNDPELSALGVARMAGLSVGLWAEADLDLMARSYDVFAPASTWIGAPESRKLWTDAISRSVGQAVLPTPPGAPVPLGISAFSAEPQNKTMTSTSQKGLTQ